MKIYIYIYIYIYIERERERENEYECVVFCGLRPYHLVPSLKEGILASAFPNNYVVITFVWTSNSHLFFLFPNLPFPTPHRLPCLSIPPSHPPLFQHLGLVHCVFFGVARFTREYVSLISGPPVHPVSVCCSTSPVLYLSSTGHLRLRACAWFTSDDLTCVRIAKYLSRQWSLTLNALPS